MFNWVYFKLCWFVYNFNICMFISFYCVGSTFIISSFTCTSIISLFIHMYKLFFIHPFGHNSIITTSMSTTTIVYTQQQSIYTTFITTTQLVVIHSDYCIYTTLITITQPVVIYSEIFNRPWFALNTKVENMVESKRDRHHFKTSILEFYPFELKTF